MIGSCERRRESRLGSADREIFGVSIGTAGRRHHGSVMRTKLYTSDDQRAEQESVCEY